VLEHFELQQRHFEQNAGRVYCFGFWWWKRANTRPFLQSPEGPVRYCWSAQQAVRDGFDGRSRALSWGYNESKGVAELCRTNGVNLERMEDGFIRSVGLGSDLTAPWSLVVDRQGIYFDPTRPSDLESLLLGHAFSETELQRARRLRERLVASGLSKYNQRSDGDLPADWSASTASRVLVPGQVEDDASIRLGCPGIRTNLQLLQRVREQRPNAFVLFKPHPDVLAGNRPGKVDESTARRYCDAIVTDVSIAECLQTTDEVHTLTSLVGFEALLRGVRVVTYGQPFYASWGLTEDDQPVARRSRRLHLDELIAGALLLYPRYVDPTTGYFCSAEHAIARLLDERERAHNNRDWLGAPYARRLLRAMHFVRGMLREAPCV
jgi:capsular polysaccharide export protein